MKDDCRATPPLPHLLEVDKEIYSTFFPDVECPRGLSLVEEIYRPFATGFLNLRHHLLDEVVFELQSSHITPVQAVLMYLRVVESHNFNLAECLDMDSSDKRTRSINLGQILTTAFDEKAKNFQKQLEIVSCTPKHMIQATPLCREALASVVIKKSSQ
jgi:hypothetical protein